MDTDTDQNFYQTICRVCLSCSGDKNMVSLLENEETDVLSCYGVAVTTFADIVIKSDSLPHMMCQSCLLLLKQAIRFKKTCDTSNETLKRLVKNFGDSSAQNKEIIAQYVMFSHYFADVCTKDSSESNKVERISSKIDNNSGHSKDDSESLDITVIIERIFDKTDNDVNFQDDFSLVENCEDFQNNQITEKEENNEKSNIDNQEEADYILDGIEEMLQIDPATINSYLKKYPKRAQKRCSKFIQQSMLVKKKNKLENKIRNKLGLPKRNVQCEICYRVLANYQTYQMHMQRHNGKRFVCELCGKAFAANAFLQSHQAAIHNCGRFFACTVCDYKAVRKWDLDEHQRIHTGERPYTCEKCGMTFRRQYIWKKHALYHKEKTVQCPKCPCKFHQKGEMHAHYNNIHERLYVYVCQECGVTYAKTSTVRRHLFDKHGIAREKQGKIKRIILGRMSVE